MAETFHTPLPNFLQVISHPPHHLFLVGALGGGSHSKTAWISEQENALCHLIVKLVNVMASPQSKKR